MRTAGVATEALGPARMAAPEVRDDLGLSPAALAVVAARYLRRDERGRPCETPGGMLDRVATAVAAAERRLPGGRPHEWAEPFAALLRSRAFLPNSPTLMNAGTPVGVLSGCFVLPVEDTLWSIFTTLRDAALIHQAGGGTGFAFSALRPAGDPLRTTGGVSSGPVSFMRLYDRAAQVVALGGRRRAANMAVLAVDHPDVEAFVDAKVEGGGLETFNLSVAATDRFMAAARDGGEHSLVNPRTGRMVRRMPARALLERICERAWACGDPGLVFIDRINRSNPVPALGPIAATNPCGEVPLLPYESCNLGSIDLARFVSGGQIDRAGLAATAAIAVRFLDDVIDAADYPTAELSTAAHQTRKIGLGVMGLADALIDLGVPYDSPEALTVAGSLIRTIADAARRASEDLADERGPYPAWPRSRAARRGGRPRRNAQLLSIAPTGTISLIAGTSAGIEPLFALAYTRNVLGRPVREVHPALERLGRGRPWWTPGVVEEIGRRGSVRDMPVVPEDVRRVLATALDIEPDWHVRMQAAVQRHVDAAVAKTVNLPASASVTDIERLFLRAWAARVKGITVFRDTSRPDQVLRLGAAAPEGHGVHVDTAYTGGCIGPRCDF